MAMAGFDRLTQKYVEVERTPLDCSIARWPVYAPSWRDRRRNADSDSYQLLTNMWFKHLSDELPGTFVVEFDPQMQAAAMVGGGMALEDWMRRARACGYYLVNFTAQYGLWLESMPWSSLVVVGFSKSCGGAAAATWFRESMQPALVATRAGGPPCCIWAARGGATPGGKWGVLDPDDQAPLEDADEGTTVNLFI